MSDQISRQVIKMQAGEGRADGRKRAEKRFSDGPAGRNSRDGRARSTRPSEPGRGAAAMTRRAAWRS